MSNLYEVEAILLSRPLSIPKAQPLPRLEHLALYSKEYFVKWKGYSIVESTWEPYTNLKSVDNMVRAFVVRDEQKLQALPNYRKQIGPNPIFACEELTSKRTVEDRTEYLVKWKDFITQTWESESSVPAQAIEAFNSTLTSADENNDNSDFGGVDNLDEDDDRREKSTSRKSHKSDDELEEEPVTSKQRSGKRKIDKVSSDTEEPEAKRVDIDEEELLRQGDWKLEKVGRSRDGSLYVSANHPDHGSHKFDVELFRQVDPQNLLTYFLDHLRFQTANR